jgi:hypothetical protein
MRIMIDVPNDVRDAVNNHLSKTKTALQLRTGYGHAELGEILRIIQLTNEMPQEMNELINTVLNQI